LSAAKFPGSKPSSASNRALEEVGQERSTGRFRSDKQRSGRPDIASGRLAAASVRVTRQSNPPDVAGDFLRAGA
jgi:hypothetical protein